MIQCVMSGVEPPLWDLAPTALSLEEGVGMIHQDPDNTSSVMVVTVRAQYIPCAGGTRKYREGAGESISRPREAHIVNLMLVLRLTDCQTAPVNHGFRPTHTPAVCCH